MSFQISPNPRTTGRASIAANTRARGNSVFVIDWDHVTGKPNIISDIGDLGAGTAGYHIQSDGSSPGWAGFLQSGTGAQTRTWSDKAKDFYSLKDFGAVGDGVTNDYAAIAAAISAARTDSKTLIVPDGTYAHGSTIEWGYSNLRVLALSENVTFKHTGTGVGNSFNGIGNYPASQGAVYGVFGGPGRIRLLGNANTTNLVLVDNWHWGYMKVSMGTAASNAFLLCQDNGIVSASAVETLFDVIMSYNVNGALTTVPLYGIRATSLAACTFFNPTIEGVGNVASSTPGISWVGCIGNLVLGGTTESCLAGGISLNPTSKRNTFINHHSETNGTQQDWIVSGNNNSFISCAGSGTTSGQFLAGNNNQYRNCNLQSAVVQTGATENVFDNCTFVTAFTDSGTRTTIISPDAIATAADKSTSTLSNKTIAGANNTLSVRIANDVTGLGTGIAAALAVNTGSAGAPVLFNGALGAPSSGTVTNLTGTASININGTVGATTPNTGAFTTLSASGLISANGGQIKFPATQSASADANTLDDYEEGTFTPSLQFGGATTGITYTSRTGRYTKIGDCVNFVVFINLSSKGSATGAAVVTGLPFTVGESGTAFCRMNNGAAAAATVVYGLAVAATTSFNMERFATGVATTMTDTDFNNNTNMRLSGMYFV